jgi:hypothetical protein
LYFSGSSSAKVHLSIWDIALLSKQLALNGSQHG